MAWSSRCLCALLLVIAIAVAGCSWRRSERSHHFLDSTFGERHTGHHSPDSVLHLASELTSIEDEIRRNGSITVKAPDVWGDANLMSSIQEYEKVMKDSVEDFDEVLSAYLARSDQAEFQSATGVAAGAAGGFAADTGAPTALTQEQVVELVLPAVGKGSGANIPNQLPGDLLENLIAAAPPRKPNVGVEPTELLRQESTYIQVNQALRRRNMGDERSRQAGYGLYKFRVPISVLPGRQTHEGYSAVVNMRARLAVDAAHLRYTFPKLVVADVVDDLSVYIHGNWKELTADDATCSEDGKIGLLQSSAETDKSTEPTVVQGRNADPSLQDMLVEETRALTDNGPPLDVTLIQTQEIYGCESVLAIAKLAGSQFKDGQPKLAELRNFLFENLTQQYEILRRQNLLSLAYDDPSFPTPYVIADAANDVAKGCDVTSARCAWVNVASSQTCIGENALIAWPLALQAGLLDHNIKRMIEGLALEGKVSQSDAALAESVYFFQEEVAPQEDVVRLWEMVIQENFPVHVFALDPQVEEQNVYDAFSRRREMQIALAISVARGSLNTAQRVDMSRQLALDMASIDLNRTAVAFSHDNDTFGWYFYPRVQSPPQERNNVAALARLIWSTGPTEHYDQKHLSLEPGMRECEVLIAMPSFVPHVEFDVTTNWERLTKPGATKQSYEEMVALGGRIHRLRGNLREAKDAQCFRPGDYARLVSRVDQLEKMLSLQSYEVNVPYAYEQSGTTLFNKGDVQLRPVLHGVYGLDFVTTEEDAGKPTHFFLQGQNFHPTLTHVIIGGAESDSYSPETEADVQVISRELIRVKVNGLSAKLSENDKFVIRCGTPAGLSNPLWVDAKAATPPKTTAPDFALKNTAALSGTIKLSETGQLSEVAWNERCNLQGSIRIDYSGKRPLPVGALIEVIAEFTIQSSDGETRVVSVPVEAHLRDEETIELSCGKLRNAIADALGSELHATKDYEVAKGKLLLRFGEWPFISVGGELLMKVVHAS
ncbi:putative membrane or secreted protein [Rhodopirellula maiorica SM1]|uniref:Putative membrane or secreted protein n=1 Tax=Rhodopirellula maiorica SM1 TaxID=1265738 RepID=M5S9Q0_9BACT|nr:hypothetical protein [Rhodopirellula maiorica]EMI22904.1 putative membrane or secreted protein [Rhodopirellula maiorica SM1]